MNYEDKKPVEASKDNPSSVWSYKAIIGFSLGIIALFYHLFSLHYGIPIIIAIFALIISIFSIKQAHRCKFKLNIIFSYAGILISLSVILYCLWFLLMIELATSLLH